MRALFTLFLMFSFMLTSPSLAQSPTVTDSVSEIEVERRAKEIGLGLRCVMCKNESIEESPSNTAQDMRRIVREKIRSGETNTEIMAYMQSRYGDFVLLKPPVQPNTYLLWGLPFILLAGAMFWFWRAVRRYSSET